jgi:LuxR family maltose regulon positive regulatory protein
MPSPLVETKLYVPPLRPHAVSRPRLTDLLDRGCEARLTLISAPPGFGKTTALAAWLAERAQRGQGSSVAWLSLEESERAPASFWTYVLSALESAVPGLGAGVRPLLQSPQPPIEAVLTTVLNELGTRKEDLYLVLDDYHLADGPLVASGMLFLLGHLPPCLHVVLSTRSDPDLALARLRARGDLVEVRATDLRFTVDEVAAYLNGASGLDLDAEHVAVLAGRTEGWIAALQLAALSMRGRSDVAGFVEGFAGDDRYIVDYLVEEVLARQPGDVRTFLVQTSILDRLTGPLCDAVTGQGGGKVMLETLERANLFVVPLDDNRRWYRYHHLFADVLLTHLADERPELVRDLHRRASRWYDEAGEPLAAVRHALAGGDVDRAAELVEIAIPVLQRERQEATIRGWLDDIPDEVVRARPVLAVGFIGALMSGNEFDAVPARLREVERLLEMRPAGAAVGPWRPPGTVVVDDAELARLPGAVELYWAGLALVHGEVSETYRHARLAVDRAAPADDLTRAGAAALCGLASWSVGDLEAAHRGYSACVDGLRRAGHVSDVLGCTITLADLLITQGRLGEALVTCEGALELAEHESGVLRGTADMYVAISGIALDRGDLDAAVDNVRRSRALGEHLGLPQHPYRWRLAMARIRQLQGDLAGALDLVDEARRVFVADFIPDVRPVPAVRARLLAAAGDIEAAWGWASTHGVTADDDLAYVHEFEHITLARVFLAQDARRGSPTALRRVAGLLDRLLAAADEGGRVGNVIEILVLRALARRAQGDVPAALAALERSLELAEPEGYVTVFAAEGTPMATLLTAVAARRPGSRYLSRLVAACASGGLGAPAERQAPQRPALVAPLSARELEVLRLLASDLSGPDIARELVVSLHTVRSHTKSIYAKLGVSSRRAAVRQASDLDLFTRQRTR